MPGTFPKGVQITQVTPFTQTLNVSPFDPTSVARVREALEASTARRKAVLEEYQARRREATQEAKTQREEFRTRLSEIRDLRKRKILENLNEKLTQVHERWLEHWSRILDRLSRILAKIETRKDKLADNGCEVSGVTSAISAAEAAIAGAQEVLNEQAGKTYVIEISEEQGLGEDVRALIAQFKEDMKATLAAVKGAREAVHDAFAALKDARLACLPEGGSPEEATEGGTESP